MINKAKNIDPVPIPAYQPNFFRNLVTIYNPYKMKLTLIVFTLLGFSFTTPAQKTDTRYFELRTYHCNESKRPDLIRRFQDHTLRLLERHGITNVAYFLPTDQNNNTLTFVLAYPDKASREVRWNNFANDPEWKEAARQSEANGKLVAKVDQTFMTVVPELSPKIKKLKARQGRIFELRTYHLLPGKLENIDVRFRDHTRKLFEKQGMINVVYWHTVPQDGTQPKLVYLLAHNSEAAAKASFDAFRKDPQWVKVRDASEENGKIVEKVESVYLTPLEFSALK